MEPREHWWEHKWKPRVEIAGLVVLAVYTVFTGVMSFANLKSADAAKSAAETAAASTRPWMKITSIDLVEGKGPIKTLMFHWPGSAKRTPPFLQYSVSLQNVGHTIAQDIRVIPYLYFGILSESWHDDVSKKESAFCGANAKASPGTGAIVFPSESLKLRGGTSALEAAYSGPAALIICVNYRGAPGTYYQTSAWAGMYEFRNIVILKGVDASASDLKLYRDQSGDHAN